MGKAFTLDRSAKFLTETLAFCNCRRRQHDGEFFSSEASGTICGSQAMPLYGFCHALQHCITGEMPSGIVVSLEVIDVDHKNRQQLLGTCRSIPFHLDVLVKTSSVDQSCE